MRLLSIIFEREKNNEMRQRSESFLRALETPLIPTEKDFCKNKKVVFDSYEDFKIITDYSSSSSVSYIWSKIVFYLSAAKCLKFDRFFEFLTSSDLGWPREPIFWKAYVKSVILIYNSPAFNEVRNLTLNDPKFVIWPQTQIFLTQNNF